MSVRFWHIADKLFLPSHLSSLRQAEAYCLLAEQAGRGTLYFSGQGTKQAGI